MQTGEAGHICRKLAFGESETQMLSIDHVFRGHRQVVRRVDCLFKSAKKRLSRSGGSRRDRVIDRFQPCGKRLSRAAIETRPVEDLFGKPMIACGVARRISARRDLRYVHDHLDASLFRRLRELCSS